MEMHQVRYFLTVARTLNFTRAAEQCNVTQPALTRAIRQLEEELNGELLRREGKLTHLTELGQRMLPFMQQCYQSAMAAKALASSLKSGETQPLSAGLCPSIDLSIVSPLLKEVQRGLGGLQLRIVRRNPKELVELLQNGAVDLAIAGPMELAWNRFDTWPLFEEAFEMVVHNSHPLANARGVTVDQLTTSGALYISQCEWAEALATFLKDHNVALTGHEVEWPDDALSLVASGQGFTLLPPSAGRDRREVLRIPVRDFEFSRKVYLYGVAGRPRSVASDTWMKLLRARDWTHANCAAT